MPSFCGASGFFACWHLLVRQRCNGSWRERRLCQNVVPVRFLSLLTLADMPRVWYWLQLSEAKSDFRGDSVLLLVNSGRYSIGVLEVKINRSYANFLWRFHSRCSRTLLYVLTVS